METKRTANCLVIRLDPGEELINSLLTACQEHDSDSIRVGEYLAKDSPESYELLSDDWNKYFKTVSFSVKSDINLKKISDNTQIE